MTSTSPMMDSVHVQPLAAGMPMALSPSWKPTMMAETSHLNGARIVPKMSIRYPYSSGRSAAFSIRLSSQVLVRIVQHNNCGGAVGRPFPVRRRGHGPHRRHSMGWQRNRRLAASQLPLTAPWTVIASRA